MMEYRGHVGKVEFDDEADLFHGEVVNTRDVTRFKEKVSTNCSAPSANRLMIISLL